MATGNNSFLVIGVMSGTSLDGIDLAAVEFDYNDKWSFEILEAETIPYSDEWREILRKAIELPKHELEKLNARYTEKLGEVINNFILSKNLKNLDAVCSHGHTILHQPENGFTLQIGNLPALARIVNQKVVCDFRVSDVELGGQGAPLVPIGDKLLFEDYDFCLNLGGFANISLEKNNKRIAWDICPVNIVMNRYAKRLGTEYDDAGKFARNGSVEFELLAKLNDLPFYKKTPPKSLGLEWVQKEVFPLIESFRLNPKDVLRTFAEHVAIQLSWEFKGKKDVLVTGGGAYNSFLIELVKSKTEATIVIPEKGIIEYKEALIFGLLGVLRLRNEVNVLASVTGASRDHSSGKIYIP